MLDLNTKVKGNKVIESKRKKTLNTCCCKIGHIRTIPRHIIISWKCFYTHENDCTTALSIPLTCFVRWRLPIALLVLVETKVSKSFALRTIRLWNSFPLDYSSTWWPLRSATFQHNNMAPLIVVSKVGIWSVQRIGQCPRALPLLGEPSLLQRHFIVSC